MTISTRRTDARPSNRMGRRTALLLSLTALSGCGIWDNWFGNEKPPLPGDRVGLAGPTRDLQVDKANPARVVLPQAAVNADSPQAGGIATHDLGHPALAPTASRAWSAPLGEGGGFREKITARPVVLAGRVYAMDSDARVSAFDAATGGRIWRMDTQAEDDRSSNVGGGLSASEALIYVTTGRGDVLALETATGAIKWRAKIGAAARSAPTLADGRLLVTTVDGQLMAFSVEDGRKLWSYQATQVATAMLATPAPAAAGGVVVAGFASGDLTTVRAVSGSVLWADSLAAARGGTSLADLSTIGGMPVIKDGRVYAGSVGGLLVALDIRSGRRLWEREVATIETPWLAGDWLFVLGTDGRLAALSREEGNVAWVTQLDMFENPAKKKDPIVYMGPVLAGGRLMVVSSTSQLLFFDPITGAALGSQKLADAPSMSPIVAGGTMFIVTDDATLTAFR